MQDFHNDRASSTAIPEIPVQSVNLNHSSQIRCASLTTILHDTWVPGVGGKGRWVRRRTSTSPVEDAWNNFNQTRLGTAVHLAMAALEQGHSLDEVSHQVKNIALSVKDEGLLDQIQGPVEVEVPLTFVDPKKRFGFTARADAIANVNGVPTLIEWTFRQNRITSLQELGGDKLAQLAGTMAACAANKQEVKQALLGVLYPFGRPDFFWIEDIDLLRQVWKSNLLPRIHRYYGIQSNHKGGLV